MQLNPAYQFWDILTRCLEWQSNSRQSGHPKHESVLPGNSWPAAFHHWPNIQYPAKKQSVNQMSHWDQRRGIAQEQSPYQIDSCGTEVLNKPHELGMLICIHITDFRTPQQCSSCQLLWCHLKVNSGLLSLVVYNLMNKYQYAESVAGVLQGKQTPYIYTNRKNSLHNSVPEAKYMMILEIWESNFDHFWAKQWMPNKRLQWKSWWLFSLKKMHHLSKFIILIASQKINMSFFHQSFKRVQI